MKKIMDGDSILAMCKVCITERFIINRKDIAVYCIRYICMLYTVITYVFGVFINL